MSTETTPTAAVETQVTSSKYDPSAFLHEITGNNVVVKLSSGVEFHGKLQSVDGFMNVALESTREVINNKEVTNWGDVFLRGHNVLYISVA